MKYSLFILLAFLLAFSGYAQDDDDSYTMYETYMLKPDTKHLKTLSDNMAAHNKKYHPASNTTYSSRVWEISTGPHTGWLVWTMGPCTYSDLDDRPSADGHDEDWRDNVMPYVAKTGSAEYWRRDDDKSNITGDGPSNMLYVRMYKVAEGQSHRVGDILDRMSAAVKAMDPAPGWSVLFNEFRQGAMGRHVATISGMDSWADLDDDWPFKEAYMEAHGENSWMTFIHDVTDIFEDAYDEIWVLNRKMSGWED